MNSYHRCYSTEYCDKINQSNLEVNSYHSCHSTERTVETMTGEIKLSTPIMVVAQLWLQTCHQVYRTSSTPIIVVTQPSYYMHPFLVFQKPIKGGADLIQVGFYTKNWIFIFWFYDSYLVYILVTFTVLYLWFHTDTSGIFVRWRNLFFFTRCIRHTPSFPVEIF